MPYRPSGSVLYALNEKNLRERESQLRETWTKRHESRDFVRWLIEQVRRQRTMLKMIGKH